MEFRLATAVVVLVFATLVQNCVFVEYSRSVMCLIITMYVYNQDFKQVYRHLNLTTISYYVIRTEPYKTEVIKTKHHIANPGCTLSEWRGHCQQVDTYQLERNQAHLALQDHTETKILIWS